MHHPPTSTAGRSASCSSPSAACRISSPVSGRITARPLFSANDGVTGVLFLAGIVGCAASDALFATGLLSTGAVWFVFALLLLSIWFGEPLISMMGLAPAEHGHKTSVGMMILEGFFELFEAFLSWLSNCLSFLRVGTYAICHAIMMLIVYALSEDERGYSILASSSATSSSWA
ncbi:MAG: hypothetical protein ACLTSG_08010 [Lachnospiraceae bacterium]